MKHTAIKYSTKEMAFVEANKSLPRNQLAQMFNKKFSREVKADNIKRLCLRKGWKTGRTGRFTKGHTSWNEDKKGYMGANATSFKKGHKPKNTKYLGHERITNDGYIMISVDEENPHTGFERRYVLKHRWNWEKVHGNIPADKCLKFIDSDRQNCDISNLELIDRSMLPFLKWGKYDNADPLLKPAIMASCKIKHKIRTPKKPKARTHTCG